MSPEWVLSILALISSLVLDLVPGLSTWWEEKLSREQKRWIWLLGCLGVPLAVVGIACLGWVFFEATCDPEGVIAGLKVGFVAYTLSQAVHGGTTFVKKRLKK